MAKTNTTAPSDEGDEKIVNTSAPVKGNVDGNIVPNPETPAKDEVEVTPTAEAQITKMNNDGIPTVNTVIDGIEYPPVQLLVSRTYLDFLVPRLVDGGCNHLTLDLDGDLIALLEWIVHEPKNLALLAGALRWTLPNCNQVRCHIVCVFGVYVGMPDSNLRRAVPKHQSNKETPKNDGKAVSAKSEFDQLAVDLAQEWCSESDSFQQRLYVE
jgi:hypothetical protein